MLKLKIIVSKKKSQKTGHEFMAYKTIKADGSYIDVKFNSKEIDVKTLPESTFIIHVEPTDCNEKTKLRDGAAIVSEKTGKAIKELWISKISSFGDQAEIDAANEEYKKQRAAALQENYPNA